MRTLGTLFILLIAFAVLGWFRGWFVVETAAATRSGPRVVVDSDKVAGDARAAANKIGELSAKATRVISGKTSPSADGTLSITGEVTNVDLPQRRIDLRFGTDDLSLEVPEAALITVAGESRVLGDLRVGQTVRVGLLADGSRLLLKSIESK